MDIAGLRSTITQRLAVTQGPAEARAMERIITEELMGLTPAQAFANPERIVPDFIVNKAQRIIDEVEAGCPLQYLLGHARFMGMDFCVNPSVLIPRPETEMLVDMIVNRYKDIADLRVLDIGTGSGCIAISLARSLKFAQVTAIDISAPALDTARRNAQHLGAKIEFRQADILNLADLDGNWDIIVSNPPYILQREKQSMALNVKAHEPHQALFVPDNDPLKFYSPTIEYWRKHRNEGGSLWFEINPLCATMYSDAEILRDQYGRKRFAVYG